MVESTERTKRKKFKLRLSLLFLGVGRKGVEGWVSGGYFCSVFCFSKVLVLAKTSTSVLTKDKKVINYKMWQTFFEIVKFTA